MPQLTQCSRRGASRKPVTRSEEHTSELQSHSDLHSFPTRRSSGLVIAPLGETLERLLAEDVDAAADPVLEARSLAEAGHEVVFELDDSERRAQRHDADRRCSAATLVEREQLGQVNVHQLVAVQGEEVAVLLPSGGGEANTAAAAKRLGLGDGDDLGADVA